MSLVAVEVVVVVLIVDAVTVLVEVELNDLQKLSVV